MHYNLVYQELLYNIKNSNLTYQVREALNSIYSDLELLNDINKYKETSDWNLRCKIYSNEKFQNYKKLENDINMLILKLNRIFKELEGEL